MKKLLSCLFALLLIVFSSEAGALHLGYTTSVTGPCVGDFSIFGATEGTFTLPGVSGSGKVRSAVVIPFTPPPVPYGSRYLYIYTVDLGEMSPSPTHCVKLSIRFGTPLSCDYDVDGAADQVRVSAASPTNATGTMLSAATQTGSFIEFLFQSSGATFCLRPGETSVSFALLSDRSPVTNTVTVIDNETNRVSVAAMVPNLPSLLPAIVIPPQFQGLLRYQNQFSSNGLYRVRMGLFDEAKNGMAASETLIETVEVKDGVFTAPLRFDSSTFHVNPRWLSLEVQPLNSNDPFTLLEPRLPVAPAPQAWFAYSAQSVAELAPGQAVKTINGLADDVKLEAGTGILIGLNKNTIVISAQPGGPSDRNRKTDFTPVNPDNILTRLATLPVQSWRYTNEVAGVRHLGPVAQDFKAAFGLGTNDTWINALDEAGVAFLAIQGLNQKVETGSQKSDNRIQKLEAENTELKRELAELTILVKSMNQQLNGAAK